MIVASLFDGISCGRVALERANLDVSKYIAYEIEPNAITCSRWNWPDIIHRGSVEGARFLYYADLLIGGGPCQGFSFAGKQLNFADPRSTLFFEYVRALKELRRINPDIKFLFENVPMKKLYIDIISDFLGCEPILINSALVSAQNRKRLYWTNITGITQPEDKGILLRDIVVSDAISVNICGRRINPKTGKRDDYNKDIAPVQIAYLKEHSKAGTLATVSKDQLVLDLKKAQLSDKGLAYMQKACISKSGQVQIRFDKYNNAIDGKSQTLTANLSKGVPYGVIKDLLRRLTPVECERLQTLPDNYTDIIPDTWRYHALGNGWTVDVIAHILSFIHAQDVI